MSEETNKQDAINRIDAMFNLFGTPANALRLEDFSVERALEIAEEIAHVGIRDGMLYHYTQLTPAARRAYDASVLLMSEILDKRITDPETIAPVITLVIALDYVGIGFDSLEGGDDKELDVRLQNLDSLIDFIMGQGYPTSLARLIHRARVHEVPNHVFLESIQAVKYEEILDSVKPLTDKETEDDNTVVG
jgi:hypothetical protein